MEIELWELNNIIQATAKATARAIKVEMNPTKDEITESDAYRTYGEGWLDHQKAIGAAKWKRKGVHKNSPKIYSRKQLDELKLGPDPLLKAITKRV